MKKPLPIRCMWTGSAFIPQGRSLSYCAEEFGEGEVVTFDRHEDRSINTHNHYFASLQEAFLNLPEELTNEYPTVDHLRAKALIRTGYCNHRNIVCATYQDAMSLASLIGDTNPYAIVSVSNVVVDVWTAKSQSRKAMNKKEFQDSKTAVLDFVSSLVDVSPQQLSKESRSHA